MMMELLLPKINYLSIKIFPTSILDSSEISVNNGIRLPYHKGNERYMFLNKKINFLKLNYTQNGSYPSCKPQVVKYFNEFESCPKLNFPRCPAAIVIAGTKPLIGFTLSNAISLPDGS